LLACCEQAQEDSSDSDSDSDDDDGSVHVVRGATRNRPVPLANRILHQAQGEVVSRPELSTDKNSTTTTSAGTTTSPASSIQTPQSATKAVPRKKMGKKERQRHKAQKLGQAAKDSSDTAADVKALTDNVLGTETAGVQAEMEQQAKLQRKREKRKAAKLRKKLGSALAAAQGDATAKASGAAVSDKVGAGNDATGMDESDTRVAATTDEPDAGKDAGEGVVEPVKTKNKRKRKKVRSKQKNARKDNRPSELKPGGSQYGLVKKAKTDAAV
jgi:hypothetical protein